MSLPPPEPAADWRPTIHEAATRIAADVRRTPLWRLPGPALGLEVAEVWLKLEQLQLSGSFKARGMFNRLRALPVPAAGVVVASGGNAGIAVATAARALGVPCEVFLPEVSTPAKRAALAALGARVSVQGAVYVEALAGCLARQRETGGVGLGLHLARLVLRAHGSSLRFRNAEPGLEASFELPARAG